MTDFGVVFGVGEGILELLVEVVCEARVLSWILKFLGGGWEPKGEKVELSRIGIVLNFSMAEGSENVLNV